MKGKKEKNMKKAGGSKPIFKVGLVIMIVIGFVYGIAGNNIMLQTSVDLTSDIIEEIIEPDDGYTKSWKTVWEGSLSALAAENATISVAGINQSGILSVYFHPHQTDIGGYLENSSDNLETNCTDAGLGFANEDAIEIDLAHSTTFDTVVRIQGNNTNCKVGGVWYDTNVKVQWTCAGLGVAGDTELTLGAGEAKTTANDTTNTYLYMNFFDDNSGSGFTISQDQTIEITSIKLLMYF